jgi:hypothetical protein
MVDRYTNTVLTVIAAAPAGAANKRSKEIADKAALDGITPLEVLLNAMRHFDKAGDLEKAAFFAKDAAPYMHPRLTSVDVGGKPGSPVETKDVTMSELARRIAFIFREAAREGQVVEAVEYQEVKPSDIN